MAIGIDQRTARLAAGVVFVDRAIAPERPVVALARDAEVGALEERRIGFEAHVGLAAGQLLHRDLLRVVDRRNGQTVGRHDTIRGEGRVGDRTGEQGGRGEQDLVEELHELSPWLCYSVPDNTVFRGSPDGTFPERERLKIDTISLSTFYYTPYSNYCQVSSMAYSSLILRVYYQLKEICILEPSSLPNDKKYIPLPNFQKYNAFYHLLIKWYSNRDKRKDRSLIRNGLRFNPCYLYPNNIFLFKLRDASIRNTCSPRLRDHLRHVLRADISD